MQGPTHHLEVHPPLSPGKHHGGENGGGGGGGTVLRLSDLSDSSSDVVRVSTHDLICTYVFLWSSVTSHYIIHVVMLFTSHYIIHLVILYSPSCN